MGHVMGHVTWWYDGSTIDSADSIAKDLIAAGLVEGRELVVGEWFWQFLVKTACDD